VSLPRFLPRSAPTTGNRLVPSSEPRAAARDRAVLGSVTPVAVNLCIADHEERGNGPHSVAGRVISLKMFVCKFVLKTLELTLLDVVVAMKLGRSRQGREPQDVVCAGIACTQDVDGCLVRGVSYASGFSPHWCQHWCQVTCPDEVADELRSWETARASCANSRIGDRANTTFTTKMHGCADRRVDFIGLQPPKLFEHLALRVSVDSDISTVAQAHPAHVRSIPPTRTKGHGSVPIRPFRSLGRGLPVESAVRSSVNVPSHRTQYYGTIEPDSPMSTPASPRCQASRDDRLIKKWIGANRLTCPNKYSQQVWIARLRRAVCLAQSAGLGSHPVRSRCGTRASRQHRTLPAHRVDQSPATRLSAS
jgi:hypothetical protein